MKKILLSLLVALFIVIQSPAQVIKSPADFFGFEPGSDRNAFRYEQLIDYLKVLDASSDRLLLKEAGFSPMGKPMYIAFISSEENLRKLDRLKEINRELALNAGLTDTKRDQLFGEAKVFVMATLSMHSSEIAPSQAAPLTAYDLCTTSDPEKLNWLDEIVYMMIPNHNPDGMDLIIDYYNKTKGTKYEGSSMPGVYHKYVGHDNNRDFVILSQEDTRVIARIYNTEWYPQVLVEKHQMGSTGARYFVPPNHDPIAENIDEALWNWIGVFGANLMKDMTSAGLSGVSQHYLFDYYWPGSTETSMWKNVISFLTEAASVKVATPIYVEPTELSVNGKGLSEYKKGINMPLPWPGGEWKLGDIVEYELVSVQSVLKTAYNHRKDILKLRNDLCRKQVELGNTVPPYFYVLPRQQHDPSELVKLVNLMKEHGINVYRIRDEIVIDNRVFSSGDIVIPLNQPYRAFIKEVMEKQEYPVRHYTPDGEIIKPYDIATWSLPLHNGLESVEITNPHMELHNNLVLIEGEFNLKDRPVEGKYLLFNINYNESYKVAFKAAAEGQKVERIKSDLQVGNEKVPAGSFLLTNKFSSEFRDFLEKNITVSPVGTSEKIETEKFAIPAIGLIETYLHDMDAGWTRFVFDSYGIPYRVLHPADIKTEDLGRYDVLVFPGESASVLLEGKNRSEGSYYVSSYAPEYTKGMEKEGLKKLMEYYQNGGNIVTWGQSVELFEGMQTITLADGSKEEFNLPFNDISDRLIGEGLYCPGSLVRMKIITRNSITMGMPDECGIFYRGRPVFNTRLPNFDMDRKVLGIIPENDILMSGYAENVDKLKNRPVLIWIRKGKGQMVLMGFNPQFRSSTHVSYKLLFNSLLLE